MKKKRQKKQGDFLFSLRRIKISWGLLLLTVVTSIVGTSIGGKVPDMVAQLFDGAFDSTKLVEIIKISVLSTAITIVANIFQMLASAKSLRDSRTKIWEYMMNTKTQYFDKHDPSELLTIATNDASALTSLLIQLVNMIVNFATIIVAAMIMVLGYGGKLLLAIVAVIIIHVVCMALLGRQQQAIGLSHTMQMGRLTGYLAERIRNLPMVKSFVAEEKELANGMEANARIWNVEKKYTLVQVLYSAYGTVGGIISTLISVLIGCAMLRTGELDIATFISFHMYVAWVNTAMNMVSMVWVILKDLQGRSHRLATLIRAPKEVQRKEKGIQDVPEGNLELKDVTFAYAEGEHTVLQNIDVTIPCGKITAVVGPSGSGKTTLIKLLERLYTPTGGVISVGGTDIQSLDLKCWRKKIAYVVQDAGVFSGTMRDALTYCCDKPVSDEKLMEILEKVGLAEFVNALPAKLDEPLARWGSSISGGQRQRIVIARALVQDASILIFDEPTSALDPEAAKVVSKLILTQFKNKTVIIISHELNYIAAADQIAVIHNGKLLGAGQHEELMKSVQVYRDLVEEQSYQEVFGA